MRHQEGQIKQVKRLTVGLMISGAANVALLFLVLYLAFSAPKIQFEKPLGMVEIPATYERSNGEVLRQFRMLPFEAIVQKLQDYTLIENGFTVRDLALAGLVNFHSLDIERALGRMPPARSLVIGKRSNGSYLTAKVFPGMGDTDFEKIRFFIQTEKWPQKAQGLHLILRKQTPPYDPSLLQAFAMTQEFRFISKLMQGEFGVSSDELYTLIIESDWNTIADLAQRKETGSNIRQQFLVKLIEKKSKEAARIFLKSDGNYAAFRLDDAHLVILLGLLEDNNPHAELLRKRVMASPRSDAVLAAAKKGAVVNVKNEIPFKEKTNTVAMTNVYIVQEGDNLWKISRRFNIDVERIKKQNRLESDTLQPGTTLRL